LGLPAEEAATYDWDEGNLGRERQKQAIVGASHPRVPEEALAISNRERPVQLVVEEVFELVI